MKKKGGRRLAHRDHPAYGDDWSTRRERGPHFFSNAKAENELGYVPAWSMDHAIHDAVEDFVAQDLATVAAGRLKCRGRAL